MGLTFDFRLAVKPSEVLMPLMGGDLQFPKANILLYTVGLPRPGGNTYLYLVINNGIGINIYLIIYKF